MIASLIAAVLLATAPGPLDVVKSGNTDVQKAAQAPGATVEQLSQVVERFVDFQELSKRALGGTWAKLTPEQRQDFAQTMEGLLRASYAQKAISQGKVLKKVQYGEQNVMGGEARVDTTLVVGGDTIPVKYKLYQQKGAWRIYDIVTDDVSLLETYREQFGKLLTAKGFDGLLSTLKAKRAQLEKSGAAQ
jgi:phospholipid transport system substrate-binding protein